VALMSARLAVPDLREDCRDDMAYLTRLALAADDTATAQAAAAQAETDLANDESAGRAVTTACCQALLAADASGLLKVAADYSDFGWLPSCAFALEEAAVLLAQAGDIARARAALTDAARIYTDLGAAWTIRRADGRLRPYGVRRGPRSVHRRATTGWEALTPAEVQIARLVACGASNPDIATELFLSRSTVQTHVSNILTKLGARSRVDIVRAVDDHPAAEPSQRTA
jgi:DNA-binding CsgD family transcriptional regulator